MQTFLPYPDFEQSAQVLDRQRLGKQRVEVLQILKALNSGSGWSNHPATKMWQGYSGCLTIYGLTICKEWVRRGYRDTCEEKLIGIMLALPAAEFLSPPWLGDPEFHASHRSNLLRKNPSHYGQFDWHEPDDLPYIWPSHKNGDGS